MRPERWWANENLNPILETSLPDFILAFAFFTSLAYAVLAKHFDRQRLAVTVSATLGLALSAGLVTWEQTHGYSIKNLGPIAVGLAIVVLALVMYQSIRRIRGSWAGALIALAAAIVIAQLVGVPIPVDWQVLQTLVVVASIVGIIAFTSHRPRSDLRVRIPASARPSIAPTLANLYLDRHLSGRIDRELRRLRNETKRLHERPQDSVNVLAQIRRLLPAEGHLTQRMAQLRQKAYQIRKGHIARLQETRHVFTVLPPSVKKKAAVELAVKYGQMIGIETRLERLDRAVAENERRICDLTARARMHTVRYEYRDLFEDLNVAQRLQHHNTQLFKIIERTEKKLSAIAKQVAQEVKQVETSE